MFAEHGPKLRDMGWAAVHPIKSPGKRPELSGWNRFAERPPTDAQIEAWCRKYARSGVGLVIGPDKVVVFDHDFTDPQLSVKARDTYVQIIGPTPMEQVGKFPKRKLYARHEGLHLSGRDFGSHEIYVSSGQVALFTTHPDTHRPYWWPEESPLDLSPGDLPLVTQEALDEYRMVMLALEPAEHGASNTSEHAYAAVDFKSWTSDRSHGWAAAALVTFRERAPTDPRIVARELALAAPYGNRHYMAVGAIVALVMEGYGDAEIETAVIMPYLGRFRGQREKRSRDRAIYGALHWARKKIGPDQNAIDAAVPPDEIMAYWDADWGR